MRTRSAAAALAATTLAGAATFGSIAQASPAHHGGATLRLTGTVVSFHAVPDRPSGAPQRAGDETFFVVKLSRDGRTVGRAPHHCVAADARYSLCTSVADLRRGQISLETALLPTTKVATVAVTGGTGAYRGVTGELDLTQRSDGTISWVFHLSR